MSKVKAPRWHKLRTDETRQVEETLRRAFRQVDAYRYNSASIRVRVIDPVFQGKDAARRDAMVEKLLKELPETTQADILTLYTFAPEEIENPDASYRNYLLNAEFEDPSPSEL